MLRAIRARLERRTTPEPIDLQLRESVGLLARVFHVEHPQAISLGPSLQSMHLPIAVECEVVKVALSEGDRPCDTP